LDVYLAALPLTEGYTATLRTFNVQQQQVRPMRVEVTGTETIEVPAGSFDTYVVELSALDGGDAGTGTYYVMQAAPHHVVRSETNLGAQMGGATATTQLTVLNGAQ
jgi:hypothetical protein